MMLMAMDNKSWLIEVAVVTCLMAAAMATLTFMVGHALCMSLVWLVNKNLSPRWQQA
jgi:hypothetical protein